MVKWNLKWPYIGTSKNPSKPTFFLVCQHFIELQLIFDNWGNRSMLEGQREINKFDFIIS